MQDQSKAISNRGEIVQSINGLLCFTGKDLARHIEGGNNHLILCDYFMAMLQSLYLYRYMLSKLEKQLVCSKHQRALVIMASPAISSDWQCLVLKILLHCIEDSIQSFTLNISIFRSLEICSIFDSFQRK